MWESGKRREEVKEIVKRIVLLVIVVALVAAIMAATAGPSFGVEAKPGGEPKKGIACLKSDSQAKFCEADVIAEAVAKAGGAE